MDLLQDTFSILYINTRKFQKIYCARNLHRQYDGEIFNQKMDLPDHPGVIQRRGLYPQVSELKDALEEITPKVLSERLKELEEEGIVTKKIDATAFPVKCEYTLTDSGLGLVEIIRAIKTWALKWKIDNIPCGEQDCKICVL